jgi:hypothetical protein
VAGSSINEHPNATAAQSAGRPDVDAGNSKLKNSLRAIIDNELASAFYAEFSRWAGVA